MGGIQSCNSYRNSEYNVFPSGLPTIGIDFQCVINISNGNLIANESGMIIYEKENKIAICLRRLNEHVY